jgi:hypothetical protein
MKRHATRGDARSGAATIDTQRATMFVIDSSARCGENRTGRAESVVRVRRSPRCERRSRRVLHAVPSRARRYHRIGFCTFVRGNVFNPFQQSASFHRGAPRTSRHRRARFYSNFLTFASKNREGRRTGQRESSRSETSGTRARVSPLYDRTNRRSRQWSSKGTMPFSVSCFTAGVASRREHRAVGVVHRVQKRLGAHARVSFDRTRRNHIASWFESTVTALEKCLDSSNLLLSANTFARQDTRDRDECGATVGERALDSLSDVSITDCVVSESDAVNEVESDTHFASSTQPRETIEDMCDARRSRTAHDGAIHRARRVPDRACD